MEATIGHNSQDVSIEVEVRLFNAITKYANGDGTAFRLSLSAGTTVGGLAAQLGISRRDMFLVLVNGRVPERVS